MFVDIVKEIEKVFGFVFVVFLFLMNILIKVVYVGMILEEVVVNVEVVLIVFVEKWVLQKWCNVKGIYIKGLMIVVFLIWFIDELWLVEIDVVVNDDLKFLQVVVEKVNVGKKRKLVGDVFDENDVLKFIKKVKVKVIVFFDGNDDKFDVQIVDCKVRLRKQKVLVVKMMD